MNGKIWSYELPEHCIYWSNENQNCDDYITFIVWKKKDFVLCQHKKLFVGKLWVMLMISKGQEKHCSIKIVSLWKKKEMQNRKSADFYTAWNTLVNNSDKNVIKIKWIEMIQMSVNYVLSEVNHIITYSISY